MPAVVSCTTPATSTIGLLTEKFSVLGLVTVISMVGMLIRMGLAKVTGSLSPFLFMTVILGVTAR